MEKNSSPGKGKPISRDRLQSLAVSDTGFIFDPQTGQSFTVNATGLLTLDLLKKGSSVENAAMKLADNCGVPLELASSSVEAFILQLGRYL